MLSPQSLLIGSALCKKFFAGLCCAVLLVLLPACAAHLPVQSKSNLTEENAVDAKYSIICIIHGDGDYYFHDTNNIEYKADEEALIRTIKAAEQNTNTEVFIFHQKPKRHFLLLFPLKDGEFYYYRNGSKIAGESYWRDSEESNYAEEIRLYNYFKSKYHQSAMNIFLYFGHQIPEIEEAGYNNSYPDRMFGISELAGALQKFTQDINKFDLLILASCFGGTPFTINTLAPFARYIIASPENLHLSYFNLTPLERMDQNFQEGKEYLFAKRFANYAFEKLTSEVQTSVSVAVYDAAKTEAYLAAVSKFYEQTLDTFFRVKQIHKQNIEYCDCADIPAYSLSKINDGVDVFYRPAQFGRLKNKENHSGWECLKPIEK